VSPPAVSAWDNHFRLTTSIIKSVDWVNGFDKVKITPMTYKVEQINETYEFTFKEGNIGDMVSPADILTIYSDEPDWGMDQNQKLSWQQTFMGGYEGVGSQGYIHCYYPAGCFSLPVIAMPMGMTPKRLEQIFGLIEEAVAKGDLYWAFRFSGWCIHYLQDMSQPYHTAQTSKLFYWLKDGPKHIVSGTTTVTGNFHFAYEGFADFYLKDAQAGIDSHQMIEAIDGTDTFNIDNVKKLCKKTARASHSLAKDSFSSSREFFGDKFYSSEDLDAVDEDYLATGWCDSKEKLFANTVAAFSIAGKSVRSYLSILRKRIAPVEVKKLDGFKELYGY